MDEEEELKPRSTSNAHKASKDEGRRLWCTYGVITPIFILLSLLAIIPIIFYVGYPSGASGNSDFTCDPNGDIRVSGPTAVSSLLDVKYTLSVSLGFGRLSFAVAKTIDILWDVTIGFGCQALGALTLYRVFRKALLKETKHDAAPFDVVLSLQYNPASLLSLLSYLKNATRRRSRQMFTNATLVIATAYVLVMPIWLSAMTAYQAISEPMVHNGGNLISVDHLSRCPYFFKDAARVSYSGTMCVDSPDNQWYASVEQYYKKYIVDYCQQVYPSGVPHDCSTESTFLLPTPTEDLGNSFKLGIEAPLLDIRADVLYYDDQMYLLDSISQTGMCVPQKEYSWGFSFILLFAFLITSFVIWSAVYAVWLNTFKFSDMQTKKYFGSLRTAWEVGTALGEQLGDDVEESSNKDLKARIKSQKAGIRCTQHHEADVIK